MGQETNFPASGQYSRTPHRGLLIFVTLCAACMLQPASEARAQCAARDVSHDKLLLRKPSEAPKVLIKSAADVAVWKRIELGTFMDFSPFVSRWTQLVATLEDWPRKFSLDPPLPSVQKQAWNWSPYRPSNSALQPTPCPWPRFTRALGNSVLDLRQQRSVRSCGFSMLINPSVNFSLLEWSQS